MVSDRRGQIHALEGILAALLLITSLIFALHVSAVTPMTESTSSQHIENQQQAIGNDLLAAGAEDGSLKTAILHWDYDAETYPDSNPDGVYHHNLSSQLEFAQELEKAFTERGIAYNFQVNYIEDDEVNEREIVDQGEPSDHAVVATQLVTLYEDDEFTYDDGNVGESGEELQDHHEDFIIPNEGDGRLYNVVEVEVEIWRM